MRFRFSRSLNSSAVVSSVGLWGGSEDEKKKREINKVCAFLSSSSYLLEERSSVRLTPPCVVDQAVDVSIMLHCGCDQSLWTGSHTSCTTARSRPEKPVSNRKQQEEKTLHPAEQTQANTELVGIQSKFYKLKTESWLLSNEISNTCFNWTLDLWI